MDNTNSNTNSNQNKDSNLDMNSLPKIKISPEMESSWNDLLMNIKADSNYNWDEGKQVCDNYYNPVKEQLKNLNIKELNNIVKSQLE